MKNLWLLLLLPWLILPPASNAPTLGGCTLFPADNIWNTRIDQSPLHPHSDDYVAAIGQDATMHPDFGSGLWDGGPIGIPYVIVAADQPLREVVWTAYGDESDDGPYPVPSNAPVEGGAESDGDRHVLVLQQGTCQLYELYRAFPVEGHWEANAGAHYDLASNDLRPWPPAGLKSG